MNVINCSGNACGTFGLELESNRDANAVPDVHRECHTLKLTMGTLNEGQTFDVDLWRVEGTELRAQCYFWCTADGLIPGEGNVNTTDGEKLVTEVEY